MAENVSVKRHRLKYKSRIIEVAVYENPEGAVHIDVNAAVSSFEKESFKKVTGAVNKLLFSNVRDRMSILGKLDRLPDVDYDVLSFMKKFLQSVEL